MPILSHDKKEIKSEIECLRCEKKVTVTLIKNNNGIPHFTKCLENKTDLCEGCLLFNLLKEEEK